MGRAAGPGRRPALLLGGGLLAGLAGVAISYRIAAGQGLLAERWSLLEAIALWWLVFAAGAACLVRAPRRSAVVLVLVVAVGMRVAALAGPPRLSDDLYRYAWDGRVQAAGIDPYRFPPTAPALQRLREGWLWPGAAGCRAIRKPAGCTRINRRNERTIYPPAAQLWFRGVHALVGTSAREAGWQGAALAVDLAVLAVLLALLRAWRRDPRHLVLYAWSPIAVLESVQNGHVDGLAVLFVLAALWALRRRPALAGALLAVATLIKLYPAVLLPLLLRRGARRGLIAFAGVIALGYAPHVVAVGAKVLGYLPGYLRQEQYGAGTRFLLLDAVGLHGVAAQALAAVILGAVALAVVRSRRSDAAGDRGARLLLGAVLLLASPVQPWYAVALVAVAALGGAFWWCAVAAAGYPLFFAVLLHGPQELSGRLGYGLALVAVVAGGWPAGRRRRSAAPAALSGAGG